MLVGLPVLSGVFGGFFFNCLPKYSARFIMVFHIICYGGFMLLSPSYSLFGGNEGSIHYLYAVSILWPLEMLIMYLMHRRNKSKGAAVWVQQDVGAVDLTPWKYSKIVSVIVIVCVLLVYLAFSARHRSIILGKQRCISAALDVSSIYKSKTTETRKFGGNLLWH